MFQVVSNTGEQGAAVSVAAAAIIINGQQHRQQARALQSERLSWPAQRNVRCFCGAGLLLGQLRCVSIDRPAAASRIVALLMVMMMRRQKEHSLDWNRVDGLNYYNRRLLY